MFTRVRSKLTYPHIASTLALVLAMTGGAFALQGKNSVDSGDIKKDSIKSSDIAANAAKGGDVDESTLGQVPSAANADTANTANTANTATDAGTVGGLAVREISLNVAPGTTQRDILDLAGLKLTASCIAGIDLIATTTKQDSSVFAGGIDSDNADDTDGPTRSLDSGDFEDGTFDVGVVFDVDAEIGSASADSEFGSIHYFNGDGSTVVVNLVLNELGFGPGCQVNGIAIGS